jgi:t-SNARE complex subunit (syntaxin)
MKYCTYTYKGRKIGGVKELDDFLLEKKRYESKLGDMVFSHSTRQLAALDKKAQVDKKKDELDKKYEDARKKAKQYGADEEAVLKMERPYIGVSEFLTG